MKTRLLILFTFLLFVQVQASLDDVESIVDKARSYLGEESKLKAVHAIRFHGKVKLYQEEGTAKEGEVILTFQKPYSQKIEFIFPDQNMVTGFNGYEGYEYIEGKSEEGPPARNIHSIGLDDARRNKASALENLSFFRPFPLTSDNVKDYGTVEMEDGISAHRVDFTHNGIYVFSRFFDLDTGNLLQSQLNTGITTIETGELVADGIRFSKIITGHIEGKVIYEMVFDEVAVNPDVDSSFFDYPDQ